MIGRQTILDLPDFFDISLSGAFHFETWVHYFEPVRKLGNKNGIYEGKSLVDAKKNP